MKAELDVCCCCRVCPHSTNNAIEHDDPFTSRPASVVWRCTAESGPSYIKDSWVIDDGCPLKRHSA